MSSVAGRDSSADRLDVGDSFAKSMKPASRHSAAASQIWLDGEVLSCACPDCGAPMSIRLWLALAECRMCGAQVELTEEQERQAQELLANRESVGAPTARREAPNTAWTQPVRPPLPRPDLKPLPILGAPGVKPAPAPKLIAEVLVAEPVREAPLRAEPVRTEPPPSVPVPRLQASVLPQPPRLPRRSKTVAAAQEAAWRFPWELVIACLASALVNMLIIIFLGLLLYPMPERPRVMIIEAQVMPDDGGGPKGAAVVVKTLKKDPLGPQPISPIVAKPDIGKKLQERALPQADLADLRKKVEESALANLPISAAAGVGSPTAGTLLAGRDPRVRSRLLNIEGGNDRSEIAVAMGLRWLAKHQNSDGSWSLDNFHRAAECRGQCVDIGVPSDTAGTGLALLPFLGAGYTHRVDCEYKTEVQRGLDWLVANQADSGSLMGDRVFGNTGMYAHGQATMALCEAYALTHDSKLRIPAQKAVDFIVEAQHSAGGWRYYPGQSGDTSVVGWQLMALRSAKMGGLTVPEKTFRSSNGFLKSVQESDTQGRFSYMPQSRATETMTAEGLLCRLYSGWRSDFPPLLHGADWLLKNHLPEANDSNMYYWYYATQAMHHIGGERWKKWNERMRPLLIELQDKEGHQLGSWKPEGNHDLMGGRLYMTSLAVCTLEVYYRHLPIYKNEALVGDGK
ncbi:MAG: hypothetical protein C0483_04420 [Pirellula sp.]|nr:hypothetical protein [Pirellula sp.]